MTDQSPTREDLIERLKELIERLRMISGIPIDRAFLPVVEAVYADVSLLRSDSQRIAELEGRLNGLSQGAIVAHPSVRPDEPSPDGGGEP